MGHRACHYLETINNETKQTAPNNTKMIKAKNSQSAFEFKYRPEICFCQTDQQKPLAKNASRSCLPLLNEGYNYNSHVIAAAAAVVGDRGSMLVPSSYK